MNVGAEVIVRTLKKRGLVLSVVKPGVYRVQVGALTMTARESDLEAPPPAKKKKRPPAAATVRNAGESAAETDVPASVDLHGLTVEEARNRVAGYISRAILAGHERVEIIHGIGSGKVKAAVTKDLTAISAVRAVKPHPSNPGVTVAFL